VGRGLVEWMAMLGLCMQASRWKVCVIGFLTLIAAAITTAEPAQARRHHYGLHGRHSHHRIVFHHAYKRVARHHHRHHLHSESAGGMHTGFAAIVVDGNSGRMIYGRNEDDPRHPASVTKVMTLYLLFEQLEKGRLRLDSPLIISSHAAAQAPSKLGLDPGESISVDNAIKAVVTKSANDVAVAIAENIGGDEDSFARLMTEKAHALGMRGTHFANASGLPDPAQITTARDLAVLGRAIQDRFPRYYRYFSTHSFAYGGAVHRNHNHLLGQVEGMDGIKTGYTAASGFNLLTSVRRGNHHIVAVVLGGRTAGARDRIMADLIEEHIDSGSGVRTARAVTEDEQEEERSPVPTPLAPLAQRDEGDESAEDSAPEPGPIHAAAPTHVASAQPPAQERVERARPAFVSGVHKHVEAATEAKGRAGQRAKAKVKAAASSDGSTTSTVAKNATHHDTAATTTPSALRHADTAAASKSDHPARAGWMIQIGAAEDADKANAMLSKARIHLGGVTAKGFTEKVKKGSGTLWRARFAGLEEQSAQSACKALKRSGFSCFATKN
jgi:D-alanyl-D-alanine carboxypeptidase